MTKLLLEEYSFEYCEVKIGKSELGFFRAVVQAHIILFLFHWSDDKIIGSCADIWSDNNDLQSYEKKQIKNQSDP